MNSGTAAVISIPEAEAAERITTIPAQAEPAAVATDQSTELVTMVLPTLAAVAAVHGGALVEEAAAALSASALRSKEDSMTYALINDGVVSNIISLDSRAVADFPNAVNCMDKPVAIGDTYSDGRFYHNGEEVLSELEEVKLQLASAEAAYTEGVNSI